VGEGDWYGVDGDGVAGSHVGWVASEVLGVMRAGSAEPSLSVEVSLPGILEKRLEMAVRGQISVYWRPRRPYQQPDP
jgi:hypothetical protein